MKKKVPGWSKAVYNYCPEKKNAYLLLIDSLVDMGEDMCVFPKKLLRHTGTKTDFELYAVRSGSKFATNLFVKLSLNFKLFHNFK